MSRSPGDELSPSVDRGLDISEAASSRQLSDRLSRLPPGHPSSPFEADGTRRKTPPRLHDLDSDAYDEEIEAVAATPADQEPETQGAGDRPPPLTDAEWSERYTDARAATFEARRSGLETNQQNTIDDLNQIWTPERTAAHETIISGYLARASDVPRAYKAVMAGGLGGAGKSTVLDKYAGIDESQYLKINPDDIKGDLASMGLLPELDGVTPMEASDLAHEEASYISKQLAGRAREQGINITWDITMSSLESTEKKINELRSSGYEQVVGVFVDIPVEISVARAEARHRAGHELYRAGEGFGGRLVRPELIYDQADAEWGSQNRRTFESLKHRFDSWSIYDNSVEHRAPLLIERSPSQDPEREEKSA
jgi:predicted ABC-type ATPase